MAKGADEKLQITKKILSTFDGSFLYNDGKEVRIPIGDVQIKVTLTCAKENVEPEGTIVASAEVDEGFPAPVGTKYAEPTQEELDKVAAIWNKLMNNPNL